MSCSQMARLAAVLLLSGCGTNAATSFERVAVQGKVTLDGQPLSDASIRFLPAANTVGPKVTLPVREGIFQADHEQGPVAGLHRVEIVLTDAQEHAHDDEQAWEKMKSERAIRKQRPGLPAIYNERSTLTATITPRMASDVQSLEYALKSR
jgi:hypothetical protein